MSPTAERYEKWVPIPGLPEAPLSSFDCIYKEGWLSVTAFYMCTGAGHELQIKFDLVEAFKCYEEFSDPWMATTLPLPQIVGEDHRWRYPLQEVVNSSWIARVVSRNGGIDGAWRHLVIATGSDTLHIMTDKSPRSVVFI